MSREKAPCRREPDNLEETQPCKLHKEKSQLASGFDPSTFLVGGIYFYCPSYGLNYTTCSYSSIETMKLSAHSFFVANLDGSCGGLKHLSTW